MVVTPQFGSRVARTEDRAGLSRGALCRISTSIDRTTAPDPMVRLLATDRLTSGRSPYTGC
jgi:hypothetical protein